MADTSDMGRSPGASPSALTQAEPGASDNRLSLSVNDEAFAFTQQWEDGKDYDIKLRVTQLSPGEFEVISGESEDSEEDEAGEGMGQMSRRGAMGTAGDSADMESESSAGGDGYRNPAIAKLMAEEKD